MDITARFCGKEMQDYGACVARNPSSWQEQCQHMKLKVAQCTSSHPVIQKIRSDCAGQFAEFERCLQDHQSSAAACSAHMSRFLACAEAVDLSSVDHAGFVVHLWEHEDGGLIHGGLVLSRDADLSQQSARS